MSHLSHKLPWHLLVDFMTPHKYPGVRFPVGECNRIHVTNKKVELRLKNCKFIDESKICTDPTCTTKPEEKVFYKNSEKSSQPFTRRKGGQTFDKEEAEKFDKFMSYFEKAILEFVQTEMDTPVKDLDYKIEVDESGLTSCYRCNDFIILLEFGDKKELFKYSDQEIAGVFSCLHGGQAVGTNLPFLMYHVFTFYLSMNTILHANLKKDDWPDGMKPDSHFRRRLKYRCDGQTFLPHSRKYLSEAMIDLEKTKILNKNLFRFIYFYVMMQMKIDKNYSFLEDFSSPWMLTRVKSTYC